jgi:hypothetical protein
VCAREPPHSSTHFYGALSDIEDESPSPRRDADLVSSRSEFAPLRNVRLITGFLHPRYSCTCSSSVRKRRHPPQDHYRTLILDPVSSHEGLLFLYKRGSPVRAEWNRLQWEWRLAPCWGVNKGLVQAPAPLSRSSGITVTRARHPSFEGDLC